MKKLLFILVLFAMPAFAQFGLVSGKPIVGSCYGGVQLGLDATNNVLYSCGYAQQWAQVGGTGGGPGGGVSSFSAGNLPPLFTSSVANATTTPALTFSLSNAGANTLFGNFSGSSAAPSFLSINGGTSCGDSTHALNYTAGTGFGCQTLTGGGGSIAINQLSNATAPNTITNGTFQQLWQFSLTGSVNQAGIAIGESAFSTNSNTATSLFAVNTLASSTVSPFQAYAHGGTGGLTVLSTGDVQVKGPVNFSVQSLAGATSCLQADTNGVISRTGSACGSGGGGLADPGSNGIIKRTALNTTAIAVVADINALGTLSNNTTGTAANLTAAAALPNGTTATTQAANDNSTNLATTAYVDRVGAGSMELCHNYTPGTAGSSGAPFDLINCTPAVPLVVGAHYRVLAGLQLVTSTGPTASTIKVQQNGTGGNIVCDSGQGANPAASLTLQGFIQCDFTVISSTNAVTFGGVLAMTATTGQANANKAMYYGNSQTITTTGTPTIDIVVTAFGTASTWTGANIVVMREY